MKSFRLFWTFQKNLKATQAETKIKQIFRKTQANNSKSQYFAILTRIIFLTETWNPGDYQTIQKVSIGFDNWKVLKTII